MLLQWFLFDHLYKVTLPCLMSETIRGSHHMLQQHQLVSPRRLPEMLFVVSITSAGAPPSLLLRIQAHHQPLAGNRSESRWVTSLGEGGRSTSYVSKVDGEVLRSKEGRDAWCPAGGSCYRSARWLYHSTESYGNHITAASHWWENQFNSQKCPNEMRLSWSHKVWPLHFLYNKADVSMWGQRGDMEGEGTRCSYCCSCPGYIFQQAFNMQQLSCWDVCSHVCSECRTNNYTLEGAFQSQTSWRLKAHKHLQIRAAIIK